MTLTSVGAAAPGWPASGAAVDGDDVVVVSRNLRPTRVVRVDTTTWNLDDADSLGLGDGAWGVTRADDGVYLGLLGAKGSGNLYRIVGGNLQLRAAISADFIWDLASASGGPLFGVCNGPPLVFAFDRGTGVAKDIGVLAPGEGPRTCTVVGSRLVVGGAKNGQAFLVHTALNGTGRQSIVPFEASKDEIVYCSAAVGTTAVAIGTAGKLLDTPSVAIVPLANPGGAQVVRLPREALVDCVAVDGNAVFATARPSGALYRVDRPSGALHRLDVPVPLSETRELAVRGQRIIGVSADGSVWAYDRGSDTTTVRGPASLGLADRPQKPQSIVATSSFVDVGGSFSLTRHDLASSSATSTFVPGEPKDMAAVGGTTYLAMYPIGEVWCWRAGEAGPRRLTQLPRGQLRPIALRHVPQLDALVVTTTNDRDTTGLHTVDPVTGRVDSIANPFGGASGVAGLGVSGTTVFVGGTGDTPAVAAFDLLTNRQLWQIPNAVPNGGFVLGLDLSGNQLMVSTSRGWLAAIDVPSRTVTKVTRVAQEAGKLARVGPDLMLATSTALLRINRSTVTATPVEQNLAAEVWGFPPLVADPQGRAWLIKGRDLVHT